MNHVEINVMSILHSNREKRHCIRSAFYGTGENDFARALSSPHFARALSYLSMGKGGPYISYPMIDNLINTSTYVGNNTLFQGFLKFFLALIIRVSEQKARVTYDNILRLSDDPDVNDVIRFLREREIVHFQRIGDAIELLREKLDRKNVYFMNPAIDM